MALVACKECGKEISKKAEACPHCGFKPKRTSLFTKIVAVVFVLPVFLAVMFGAGQSGSSSSSPPLTPEQIAAKRESELQDQRESYARIIAERAITQRLKAPSTADFSGYSDTQVGPLKDGGPNKWIVKGYVDSQNSFGAMLRNNYQVIIEFEEAKHDSSRIVSADLY